MTVHRKSWVPAAIAAVVLLALGGRTATAQSRGPVVTDPVSTALLPLPDTLRGRTTVRDHRGEVLRQGTNGLTCLADRPGDWQLSLVCYPSAIEPYMRRGRELAAADVRGAEARAILGAEVRSGRLFVPRGTLVRNISGAIDSTTARLDSVSVWLEILLPFATAEEVGIPETNQGLDPWMMRGGTVGTHVMIGYRSVPWSEIR